LFGCLFVSFCFSSFFFFFSFLFFNKIISDKTEKEEGKQKKEKSREEWIRDRKQTYKHTNKQPNKKSGFLLSRLLALSVFLPPSSFLLVFFLFSYLPLHPFSLLPFLLAFSSFLFVSLRLFFCFPHSFSFSSYLLPRPHLLWSDLIIFIYLLLAPSCYLLFSYLLLSYLLLSLVISSLRQGFFTLCTRGVGQSRLWEISFFPLFLLLSLASLWKQTYYISKIN